MRAKTASARRPLGEGPSRLLTRGFHGSGVSFYVGFCVPRGCGFGFTLALQSLRARRHAGVYGEIVIAIVAVVVVVVELFF